MMKNDCWNYELLRVSKHMLFILLLYVNILVVVNGTGDSIANNTTDDVTFLVVTVHGDFASHVPLLIM